MSSDITKALIDGDRNIDRYILKTITWNGLQQQMAVDWETFNLQHYTHEKVSAEDAVTLPELPPCYKPYRSYNETWEFEFGGLVGYAFEPVDYKLTYSTESTYQVDTVERENDRIFWELKGIIKDLHDAKKYINVSQQYGVHFIFVFMTKGRTCPWALAKPARKDGTRMTMEEWCDKEGFDYTYTNEVDAFKAGDHFKWLVAEVGKGMPPLKECIAKAIRARTKSDPKPIYNRYLRAKAGRK